jgi:hypothetical protein
MAKNPVFHARTKHVEVMHHFIREKILSNEITLNHVATQEHTADIFTKALGSIKFQKHSDSLKILSLRKWGIKGATYIPFPARSVFGKFFVMIQLVSSSAWNHLVIFRWYLDDIWMILMWYSCDTRVIFSFPTANSLNFQNWTGNLVISLGWF